MEKIKKMIIKIPFRTPTINHLFWHRGNMKIMKTEAREIREEIKKICQRKNSIKLNGKKLRLNVEVYENWHTKKGEVKKMDISNREKFLVDSIFLGLGLDDKFIFEHTMKKIQSDKEKSVVKIEEIK